MEDQEQVQNLQGQVSELKDQLSELMRLMKEMSQNKPTSDLNQPLPPPPPTTVDSHYASTSFTFQPSIPDPTVTVPLNNEPPFSYYPAVPNAEPSLSVPNPPIHPTPHFPVGGIPHTTGGENKVRENEKLSALEERLRAIEGLNMYGSVDMASLRLVPDVVVPPKFKVPDFDKYTGNSDPRIHLATYIAKMSSMTDDDRLLIHFFHESLSGAALRWCVQLDRSRLRSWKDLAEAFLKQYKFNCDVAPTRRDLQNLVQKDRESFKEYAQRWREKAAEVHPPVTDNELCSLFIETLKAPYFNLMIGNTSNSFSDIIQAGERIEANLRMGRLQELAENPAKKTASFGKKKEGDVHSATRQNNYSPFPQNNYRPYPPSHGQTIANIPPLFPNYPQPRPQYPPPTNFQPRSPPPPAQPRPPQNNPRPPRNPDPPLPLPLSEIYRYLVGINQIVPVPLDSIQPPYPRWYDATARCEYHGGAQGHSTDNCEALRGRVHALIRNGWLKIEGNGSLSNVTSNPLPNHNTGSGVNMIEYEEEGSTPEVDKLVPHFEEIFAIAMREGYLCPQVAGFEESTGCPYHGRAADHELRDCEGFKREVQNLLSLKVLRYQTRSKTEEEVNTTRFSQTASTPKPRITFSPSVASPPVTVIRTPPQLPVTNTHAVPWNYNFQVFTQGASSSTSAPSLASPPAPPKPCFAPHEHFRMTYAGPTSNITPQTSPQPIIATKPSPPEQEVEFITRSGRCYGNEEREKRKGKVKMGESSRNTEEEVEKAGEVDPAEHKEEEELLLQIMKQSEYDVVEQLRKTPPNFIKYHRSRARSPPTSLTKNPGSSLCKPRHYSGAV
ncbi:hypothetical protein P3X46_010536 [Hevea brasiliensis]|uniref:Retrotransposon gag domain-containing protein n=1 Tax=Hevea brasiliensis TaxID=3981 RepID=A0ABQ9MEC1_HEVBR|nr:hypothetical protein P3X46_010536 [Hevea brasiliensis]